MRKWCSYPLLFAGFFWLAAALPAGAQEEKKEEKTPAVAEKTPVEAAQETASDGLVRADSAWMLVSTAFVMFMVPGLALFYGGMVRRKNVLATMMQSMVCLSVVGVYWMAIGYALAFGDPSTWLQINGGSLIGWSPELVFLRGVKPDTLVPNTNIPVYLHMLFQGMFAIITPALISGAIAERIRFGPYLLFVLAWVTFVYCPLAHCVWAMDWNWANTLLPEAQRNAELFSSSGKGMVGWLGKMGALDFAGGTVVHIAAGLSSLAAIIVLRRRLGYPEQSFHPNSMVLTLTGAGLLWFGWFGFNGGSALSSGALATSAFAATQAAAAAAGLSWMLVEWIHRGKPTALGLASGIVAGLVAVTPASGYILPWHGLVIGGLAGVACYGAVFAKTIFKYDDSLDAFGVHGVGGFLGAVLTGVFCLKSVNTAGNDGLLAGNSAQLGIQLFAAVASVVLAFVVSLVLVKVIDLALGFVAADADEVAGLDRIEHGETGFDFGLATESVGNLDNVPRSAMVPPNGKGRFGMIVEGTTNEALAQSWGDLWKPGAAPSADFKAVYPYLTTVRGNRFQFRGGDQEKMRESLQRLLEKTLNKPVRVRVDA